MRPLLFIMFPQGLWKSKKFGHWTSARGENTFKQSGKTNKKSEEKKLFFCRGDFRPFLSKNVQIWDYFFPLLFPKDSEYLKSLDIGIQKVGAKSLFNKEEKMWRTDKNTGISTYRKNQPRGPILWKTEDKRSCTDLEHLNPKRFNGISG